MLNVLDVQEQHQMDWYEEQYLDQNEYCLSLITYGNCVYWVSGQKTILEKGDLLLIPPESAYYGKSVPTRVHTKQVVRFSVQQDAALPLLRGSDTVQMKPGGYDLYHDRLQHIAAQWRDKPPYYRLLVDSLMIQLLVELNREYDRGVIREDKHRLVDTMKRYIQQNYSRRITKEHLGELIQRTPNYAATLFKNVTGQTISEYVHDQRMKRAVYMLTESQLTITEIAEFLGYQEVSYFYRIFKRKMGVPPAEMMNDRPSAL
ncbi:helix-turn-helix transcriptional regulator [Paenibacillus wulumuqiensis]|uniref:helix-turn-helix transcriptional regulator n=1 Tax=Paenibacillus wulumuqiensis TaxID=1567107 RepID=UPI0006193CF4|nr:AraC family transcriptional regulator [Paenibacillus wulumuqiensis]